MNLVGGPRYDIPPIRERPDMSEELRIERSREGFLRTILFAVCFGVLSFLTLADQDMWLLGGIGLVASVLGLVVTILMRMPGSTHLRLYSSGFDFVVAKRACRYLWTDVDGFRLVKFFGAEFVAIQFNSSCKSQRLGRAIARGLTGIEGAISNMYERSPTQICDLLNERKSLHANAMAGQRPLP
jgi:hypothetical protein